jgi:soluble lytic murein transglycosylase-like protein
MCLFVIANANASNLHMQKQGNKIVYTNISGYDFFSNVFRIGKSRNYTKQKIIELIKKKAYKFDLDPKIAIAIAKIESSLNQSAVSVSGAVGVMQLKEKTARYYGVNNINNLEQNIEGGIRFLKHLTTKYKNLKLVAAAYNAGETAVDKFKGIPPYAQTQRYVKKFINAYYGKNIYNLSTKQKVKVKTRTTTKRKIMKIGDTYTNTVKELW